MPVEILILIMHNLYPISLFNLTRSCKRLAAVFEAFRPSIFRHILASELEPELVDYAIARYIVQNNLQGVICERGIAGKAKDASWYKLVAHIARSMKPSGVEYNINLLEGPYFLKPEYMTLAHCDAILRYDQIIEEDVRLSEETLDRPSLIIDDNFIKTHVYLAETAWTEEMRTEAEFKDGFLLHKQHRTIPRDWDWMLQFWKQNSHLVQKSADRWLMPY